MANRVEIILPLILFARLVFVDKTMMTIVIWYHEKKATKLKATRRKQQWKNFFTFLL